LDAILNNPADEVIKTKKLQLNSKQTSKEFAWRKKSGDAMFVTSPLKALFNPNTEGVNTFSQKN